MIPAWTPAAPCALDGVVLGTPSAWWTMCRAISTKMPAGISTTSAAWWRTPCTIWSGATSAYPQPGAGRQEHLFTLTFNQSSVGMALSSLEGKWLRPTGAGAAVGYSEHGC